MRSLKPP